MPHELLVGVHVVDDALYAAYREGIAPLLAEYGGAFRHDFLVSRTLTSDVAHVINRVFTLRFADVGRKDAFFSDPRYLAVRASYFPKAVKGVSFLAAYET